MNLRLKAVLYTMAFIGVIVASAVVINTVLFYAPPWLGWVAVFGFLFYCLYSLMLTKLEFDASIDRLSKDKTADQ
jgi:Zn-dependent membrane protease YugP